MPIYMDLHIVPGVNPKDVAEAHSRDVYLEKDHDCKCLTYWIDDVRGHVFCLIDAPSMESVYELHNRSHGLVPHKIIEVEPNLVESFLGRITDPESGKYTESGLLMLDDSSYRMIMSVMLPDTAILQHEMGNTEALHLINQYLDIIKVAIKKHNGREIMPDHRHILGSFITAEQALEAARSINNDLKEKGLVKISIHAGEPVTDNNTLFGETIQLLERMLIINRNERIITSSKFKELISKNLLHLSEPEMLVLTIQDEKLLNNFFDLLDKKYADTELQQDDFASSLAMSQSQFYRKITSLTGISPNELLRIYRLNKARDLLIKGKNNIAEVCFSCGFNSPSYFTKCFRQQFGMAPLAYAELV